MKKIILLIFLSQAFLFAKNKHIEKIGDIVQIIIPTVGYTTSVYLGDKGG